MAGVEQPGSNVPDRGQLKHGRIGARPVMLLNVSICVCLDFVTIL